MYREIVNNPSQFLLQILNKMREKGKMFFLLVEDEAGQKLSVQVIKPMIND